MPRRLLSLISSSSSSLRLCTNLEKSSSRTNRSVWLMCWAETPSPSSLESEFSILINKWKIIWNSRRGVEIHQWSFRFLCFLLPARVSGSDSVGWPSAETPPFSLPDSVLWPLVTQQLGTASSPELARRCLGTHYLPRCYRVGTGFRLGFISFKTSQCYWGFIVYQAPCFTSFHPHEPILRFSGGVFRLWYALFIRYIPYDCLLQNAMPKSA